MQELFIAAYMQSKPDKLKAAALHILKRKEKKKEKKKKNNTNKIHAVKNVHKSIAFLGGNVKTLRENICYKNYLSAIVR